MAAMRSEGIYASIGMYAAPDFITPTVPTTKAIERGRHSPTSVSAPAPIARNRAASLPARSCNSA